MVTDVKRILLAEDDPRDVELTLLALDEHGLANEVIVVQDGAEALDYLYCRNTFRDRPGGHPAVVMLDLKMPKVDGLQVLKIIRADASLRMIPIVILTSSREQRDLVESYNLGINAYVVKPVHFADFIAAIREIGLFFAVINESPPGSVERKR